MKNFWKFFGVVTLVVVAGFFLVSCGDDDDEVVYRDIMGTVSLTPGSQGVAGNKEVTGLFGGVAYVVLLEGTEGHVVEAGMLVTRADGTLTAPSNQTITDAADDALELHFNRTRIRGLENSVVTYSVFKVLTIDDETIMGEGATIDTRSRNTILILDSDDFDIEMAPGTGLGAAGAGVTTVIIILDGETVTTSVLNAAIDLEDLEIVTSGGAIEFDVAEGGGARVDAMADDGFIVIRNISAVTEVTITIP